MLGTILLASLITLSPVKNQHFHGYLNDTGNGILAGTIIDLAFCAHHVTLDTNTWKFDSPSQDNCRDPVNVPDLIMDLVPQASNESSTSGVYVTEPNCYQQSGAGAFTLVQTSSGVFYFDLTGQRAVINYSGCN